MMTNEEEKIRRLIGEGLYWDAIDLRHNTGSDKIIFRISDLMDEYPSLGVDLNRAQVALTQHLAKYEQACILRDQIFLKIVKEYGEECLQFISRPSIWQQIWETSTQARGPVQAGGFLQKTIKDLMKAVSLLPSVRISFEEWRKGKARRIIQQQNCGKCHSTTKVTCPKCLGKGKVKTEKLSLASSLNLDAIENNPILKRYLNELLMDEEAIGRTIKGIQGTETTCPECHGKGNVDCDCVKDATLFIPKRIKPGWVVRMTMKSKSKDSSKDSYARLDYSWMQWGREIVLSRLAKGLGLIHPWSGTGQGLFFTIGSLILIGRVTTQSSVSFLLLIRAGFQGIGQSFNVVGAFIKSPSLALSYTMDPTVPDGLLLLQGLVLILLGAALFFGKWIRNAAREFQDNQDSYRRRPRDSYRYGSIDIASLLGSYSPYSQTKAWLLNTGQYLTSRWVLVAFSGVNLLAGFSSVVLGIVQTRIGLGLIGGFSVVTSVMVLIPIMNSFFKSKNE
jgi:hypothetical protein